VNQTLGFRFQRDGIAGLGKRMPFLLNTQYGQASRPAQYQSLPQFERPFAPKALAHALPESIRVPRFRPTKGGCARHFGFGLSPSKAHLEHAHFHAEWPLRVKPENPSLQERLVFRV
jgi:hypothetical protein